MIYNTTNSIATLRKHVNANHSNVLKKTKEEMNCLLREEERQPSKNRPNISPNSISRFFFYKRFFQEKAYATNFFWEYLSLLFVKNHLLFQFVESNWLKKYSMHLCPRFYFLLENNFLMNYCSQISGKNSTIICFTSLNKMSFGNNKF
jgi:hypothetical protein